MTVWKIFRYNFGCVKHTLNVKIGTLLKHGSQMIWVSQMSGPAANQPVWVFWGANVETCFKILNFAEWNVPCLRHYISVLKEKHVMILMFLCQLIIDIGKLFTSPHSMCDVLLAYVCACTFLYGEANREIQESMIFRCTHVISSCSGNSAYFYALQ
jgi:hypothetical protein